MSNSTLSNKTGTLFVLKAKMAKITRSSVNLAFVIADDCKRQQTDFWPKGSD